MIDSAAERRAAAAVGFGDVLPIGGDSMVGMVDRSHTVNEYASITIRDGGQMVRPRRSRRIIVHPRRKKKIIGGV